MEKRAKQIKTVRMIIIILLALGALASLLYNNTFGEYPATPEEWLIKDAVRGTNTRAIITVDYKTDIIGFEYKTVYGDGKQGFGVMTLKIVPTDILGFKRYKFGMRSNGCFLCL